MSLRPVLATVAKLSTKGHSKGRTGGWSWLRGVGRVQAGTVVREETGGMRVTCAM